MSAMDQGKSKSKKMTMSESPIVWILADGRIELYKDSKYLGAIPEHQLLKLIYRVALHLDLREELLH